MEEVRILCTMFCSLPLVQKTPHSIDVAKDDGRIGTDLSLFSEFSEK